jgi:hypothetical protein
LIDSQATALVRFATEGGLANALTKNKTITDRENNLIVIGPSKFMLAAPISSDNNTASVEKTTETSNDKEQSDKQESSRNNPYLNDPSHNKSRSSTSKLGLGYKAANSLAFKPRGVAIAPSSKIESNN